MTQPKVSVIVPIYKVEKYLVQCIDSIVNQTLKDIEIILVDEGDMDACRFIIDHYEQTDPRVKTIHEKNGGYGASVNKGMDLATGEYIAIVESDDFIEPEMYQEMYACAKKLDADVVTTPYNEYWDKTKTSPERREYVWWTKFFTDVPENKLISVIDCPQLVGTHPCIWSKLMKASYLKEKNIKCISAKGAGYIDQIYREQLLLNTDKICYLHKAYYNYRLSNENASSAVGVWNINVMLDRWKEVHDYIDAELGDLYQKLAPWLIREEYVCTLNKVLHCGCKIDEKYWKIMQSNLMKTNEEAINSSPSLDKGEKEELLRFRKIQTYDEFIKSMEAVSPKRIEKTYIRLFDKIPFLKIIKKPNKTYIRLFDKIPFLKIVKR